VLMDSFSQELNQRSRILKNSVKIAKQLGTDNLRLLRSVNFQHLLLKNQVFWKVMPYELGDR